MLNKKQKIVILVSIFLLILSFLFPPWADYFPVGTAHELVPSLLTSVSEEEKTGVFVGYGSLFHRPKQYLHEFHYVTEQTEAAKKARESRQFFTGEKKLYFAELPSGKDSISALEHLDSLIQVGTIEKKEKNQLLGFAGIYHELLLIQLSIIILISVSLILVFRN